MIMCGRFTLSHTIMEVLQQFEAQSELSELEASYNIAPTQPVLAIRSGASGREAGILRWGLIPFWMKTLPKNAPMINARAETVKEKPAFRAAYKQRRCLIPADGYYEWTATETGKQPYYIQRQDKQIMAFAGLWELWTDPKNGQSITSCALLTTEANADTCQIHDRMPVFIEPQHYEEWLSNDDPSVLLQASQSGKLVTYAVDRFVNRPANNSPKCIDPIE